MAASKIEKKTRWGEKESYPATDFPWTAPCDGYLKFNVASTSGLGVIYVDAGNFSKYLCYTGTTQQRNISIGAPVYKGVTYTISYQSNISIGSIEFFPLV